MSWDLGQQVAGPEQILGGGGKEREAPHAGSLLGHSAEAEGMGVRQAVSVLD